MYQVEEADILQGGNKFNYASQITSLISKKKDCKKTPTINEAICTFGGGGGGGGGNGDGGGGG